MPPASVLASKKAIDRAEQQDEAYIFWAA